MIKNKKSKKIFLEILEKYPIITLACKKSGISRQTYYRWLKEDNDFANNANKNIELGREAINDLAESNIIQGIQNGDVRSTMFWLNNNHQNYSNRPIQNTSIHISTSEKHSKEIEKILNNYMQNDVTES